MRAKYFINKEMWPGFSVIALIVYNMYLYFYPLEAVWPEHTLHMLFMRSQRSRVYFVKHK